MSNEDDNQEDDILVSFLSDAGFKVVSFQAIIDALAEMEDYIKEQTGLSQEELESMLERIEELVGKEEAMDLELDEIISWVKAIRGD